MKESTPRGVSLRAAYILFMFFSLSDHFKNVVGRDRNLENNNDVVPPGAHLTKQSSHSLLLVKRKMESHIVEYTLTFCIDQTSF